MATGTDPVPVSKFPVGEPGAFKDHQILMVSDCDHRSIFEVTKYDAQAGTIEHAVSTATATSPGNASDDLLHVFQKSATATALQSVVYYVRTGASGGPSLWRGVDGAAPEELAEGVEKLEVRYGVDTNGDRVADIYDKASVGTVKANFANVVSVSIGLLVRSPVPYGPKEVHDYVVLDTTASPDDQYMRRVFVTTAAIRNTAL
jgi:type IV pilus assembly protein PilW